jgi:tetratricopeptide (TPR) repeat protein
VDVAREAAQQCRRISEVTDAFVPSEAQLLCDLRDKLLAAGREAEAARAGEEAVQHYQSLAAIDPAIYLPKLAKCENALVLLLSLRGHNQQALQPAHEAVNHYRQLALAQPDVYLPELAMSLNALAVVLSEVEPGPQALVPAEESVALYRLLATEEPDAHCRNLAGSVPPWPPCSLNWDSSTLPPSAALKLSEFGANSLGPSLGGRSVGPDLARPSWSCSPHELNQGVPRLAASVPGRAHGWLPPVSSRVTSAGFGSVDRADRWISTEKRRLRPIGWSCETRDRDRSAASAALESRHIATPAELT